MKQQEAQSLRDYLGEEHKDKVSRLITENLKLSTQLSAMLSMIDSYYNAYSANQREIQKLIHEVMISRADDNAKKQIARTTKNQLNKLNNMDCAFEKFTKKYSKEFGKLFNDKELEENLLDAFDTFWDEFVIVEDRKVTVRGSVIK